MRGSQEDKKRTIRGKRGGGCYFFEEKYEAIYSRVGHARGSFDQLAHIRPSVIKGLVLLESDDKAVMSRVEQEEQEDQDLEASVMAVVCLGNFNVIERN